MKNKYWVLIIAALTVIGTFWTQTELGGKKYRTHQHKEYNPGCTGSHKCGTNIRISV